MKSAIEYSGGVTAKLSVHNSNGYHFKNNGRELLWELLARAVTGNKIESIIPKSIGIYQKEDNDYISLTYSPIPIYGKVWGDVVSRDANSCSARFSATSIYTNKKKEASDTGKVVLRLLTEAEEVLAEVEDDSTETLKNIHNSVMPGIDALYEWQLTFRNASNNMTTQSEDNV